MHPHDKGMIVKPTGRLDLDCYVDADFAGLYKSDPDDKPTSAKSRTGFITYLGDCPLIWRSQLQTEISLSTLEAEYSALSQAMRSMIPLRSQLLEITFVLGLPHDVRSSIQCTVFEDNNGAFLLATNQRITARTKYYCVKWHHFWDHVKRGNFRILKCLTHLQRANYLTKGLARNVLEKIRGLSQGW